MQPMERIAQMVIVPVVQAAFNACRRVSASRARRGRFRLDRQGLTLATPAGHPLSAGLARPRWRAGDSTLKTGAGPTLPAPISDSVASRTASHLETARRSAMPASGWLPSSTTCSG
jgi:hypothetical protein